MDIQSNPFVNFFAVEINSGNRVTLTSLFLSSLVIAFVIGVFCVAEHLTYDERVRVIHRFLFGTEACEPIVARYYPFGGL